MHALACALACRSVRISTVRDWFRRQMDAPQRRGKASTDIHREGTFRSAVAYNVQHTTDHSIVQHAASAVKTLQHSEALFHRLARQPSTTSREHGDGLPSA
jgi:hypothetical protein